MASNSQTKESWIELPECPFAPGLSGHSSVVYNNIIYVFGGSDRNGLFTNAVYSFNTRKSVVKSRNLVSQAIYSLH